MAPSNFTELVNMFIELGQLIIPLLAVIALLVFLWGVAQVIRASADDKDFAEKKKFLIWGVVGMFVLFSVWGIISFFQDEFGFTDAGIPQLPTR